MADVYDIAHNITYHPRRRLSMFRELDISLKSAVFVRLSPRVQQALLLSLPRSEAVELLDHLDPRRASHVLAQIDSERVKRSLVKRLKSEHRAKAEYFLGFHPKAAISLLHFNFVLLSEDDTVEEAAVAMEEYWKDTGRFPEVLVHCQGALTGQVALSSLVRSPIDHDLKRYKQPIKAVSYQASKKSIIDTFVNAPHQKAAVLDNDGSVIGIIYSDDVLELVGDGKNASLYTFAGVFESERPFDSIWQKVSRRWKWLTINLATAFLAAGVVSMFEDIIDTIVLLAIYLPVIAGMGGNAATQTLVVMVRGIAIGEINLRNSWRALQNEIGAGLVNGVLIGILVAFIAIVWNESPLFGLVIGLAMVFNLIIAGLFGTLIPLVLKALGKDPATAATVLITTATDTLGFLVFLGLASAVLL